MVRRMKSLATFGKGPFATGDSAGRFGHYDYNDVPKLLSIFFAEFDNEIGPVIRHQVPENFLDDEVFEAWSGLIIPKPDLFNRSFKVTLKNKNYKILGYPVGLEHGAYNRNAYSFTLCFIVATSEDDSVDNDSVYEPVVQKAAEYFIELEQDFWYLTDPKTRQEVPRIIDQLFNDLQATGESVIEVTPVTSLYFKICPAYRGIEPPEVTFFMVPMFIRELNLTKQVLEKTDVLSQKIIPMIDGMRTVKEIANEVELDPDLVARCVRNLHFYECVSLVPVFLYGNTYVATERVHDFYCNEDEIQQCIQFVRLSVDETKETRPPEPLFSDVFRLYLSMRCGMTLREWSEQMQPRLLGVDEHRLVQFGMHHQFLRKLTIYPVCTTVETNKNRIFSACNGKKSLDELALENNLEPDVLHQLLVETKKFEFIMK